MDHALNFGSLMLFIAAAQGIFFSVVQLFISRLKNTPRFILALVILFFSIPLIESALWMSGYIEEVIHFAATSTPVPFIFGPLVYLYFRSSFGQKKIPRQYLLHFIPFLLCVIYCSQFYFHSTSAKLEMLRDIRPYNDFFYLYISGKHLFILEAISLLAYGFFIYREFYHKAAEVKDIRNWFMLTLGVLLFYTLNFILFHILSYYEWIGGCSDYGISTATAIFIYIFSWLAMVRPRIFDGYALKESLLPGLQERYKSSVLTEGAEAELYKKLQELMTAEKFYRNDEISLGMLSERLGTTRNCLSQVINQRAGINFFEFINQWRIAEAKKLLVETTRAELNIIEVAYEVGFNNKVSFNKSFKKITGLTPTEFRRLNGVANSEQVSSEED